MIFPKIPCNNTPETSKILLLQLNHENTEISVYSYTGIFLAEDTLIFRALKTVVKFFLHQPTPER